MTTEEKDILFKDLCGRLPYYMIISVNDGKYRKDVKLHPHYIFDWDAERWDAKPYLRPMSSMTKDEKREFQNILSNNKHGVWLENSDVYDEKWEISVDSYYPYIPLEGFTNGFDWLNKKMFDYRGLIEKGLAMEAPEGMYEIN